MRRTERAADDKRFVFRQRAADRVHARCFYGFVETHGRQNAGKPFGKHAFACSGWADQQYVMHAGRRNFKRAFGVFLSLDVAEIRNSVI